MAASSPRRATSTTGVRTELSPSLPSIESISPGHKWMKPRSLSSLSVRSSTSTSSLSRDISIDLDKNRVHTRRSAASNTNLRKKPNGPPRTSVPEPGSGHDCPTLAHICKKNLTYSWEIPDEQRVSSVLHLTHIRLDNCRLTQIDDWSFIPHLTHLYLQHNLISRLDKLESLPHLQFLVLAENSIEKIEGIRNCSQLRLLDLSANNIEQLSKDDLPNNLVYLMMRENPCANLPSYRLETIHDTPTLLELDEVEINDEERRLASMLHTRGTHAENIIDYSIIGSSAEEVEDSREPDGNKPSYSQVVSDIIARSKSRQASEMDVRYSDTIKRYKAVLLKQVGRVA
ncbi:hypothetical protein DFS34DRAFT_634392 [Phlyctochytrium arcticum]|nr:hypothetical protein DFS34DRAFT_634392 [Phlyctochytrium arcticum]